MHITLGWKSSTFNLLVWLAKGLQLI
uniref:Uncharacterized protein n=1 Tax=Anguilla anguilla TaxID=7936 RepID=A0A0E9QL64_ANGAN